MALPLLPILGGYAVGSISGKILNRKLKEMEKEREKEKKENLKKGLLGGTRDAVGQRRMAPQKSRAQQFKKERTGR